jgi:hypothetical protein
MKVIAMGGVVVRAQHHTEQATGAIANLAKKPCVLIILGPILEHADGSTVRQAETGNVQSVRAGVLASPAVFATVNVAAGKTAEVIDPADGLPVHRLCGGLQGMVFKQGKGYCQATTREKAAA